MEFRALGPLRVLRDGVDVDLGSPKQRALLAVLLAHRNSSVSDDRILDDLWGDDSDGKLNALRVYVSRLRTALEPDRDRADQSVVETVGSGYRLNVDDAHFDVARFEEMVEAGSALHRNDADRAAEVLRTALDMWSGPAYEDVMYEEFAQPEIRRLTELWLVATEDRIDADLTRGQAGELVSELELLRVQNPLRERLVAHQALALYRSGRAADALRSIARFRRHIGDELGIDPSPRLLLLEEQILLHDERIQPRAPFPELGQQRVAQNPFKGLRPFSADDVGSFFGRDALVAKLLGAIGLGQRLIALVGSSGSGKSSVVRAGLVPALAKGALEGSDQWLVASMVPGAHPFAELEAALLRSTLDAPDSLAAQLDDGDAGLVRAALRLLPDNDAHLVVIIDQFEELFTLVNDDAIRDRFLANLVDAVDDPHGRITVVVTLRADFYGQPLRYPQFGARLGNGVINVTPMLAEELEAAALRPAEDQGVSMEPALLGQLIGDVGNQHGALPLFQYALTELFDRRSGDTLTAASYRSMGGLEGALQRRATDLFDELDSEQQGAARQLFLRLVVVGEDGHRTRRRAPAREVASIGVETDVMHDVFRRFGEHRLLTFDSDPLSGAPTIEVAHEALLSAWSLLDGWIDASRDDLRRHASLAIAMREWQIADRDPDYLLPAARVAEFGAWGTTSQLTLNTAEQGFLTASTDHAAGLREAEERRLTHEVRTRRRLWGTVAALGAALGVAGLFFFGVFAADPGPTITYFGARNPSPTDASIKSGVDRADRELKMQVDDVSWTVDPILEFEELAESDPEMVIVDTLAVFAPEIFFDNPDIRFGVVDTGGGGLSALPNVTYADFLNEEGSFLAGVAAASTTETGVVGFVGGPRIDLIEQFRAGFEAGVHAVDTDIEVLATYVSNSGDIIGFADVIGGNDRATALYQRNADVIFHAAGPSGRGVFQAADEQSEVLGRHLWGIGVDVDQWFEVSTEQREHVLTSMIKRQDTAAFLIAEQMLEGAPGGRAIELGLAEGGYDYSTSGDAMSAELIATIDQYVVEIVEGRLIVPVRPDGPVLVLDADGNEVDLPIEDQLDIDTPPLGVDFPMFSTMEPGTYDVTALGTPLTVTLDDVSGIDEEWFVGPNRPGHTEFGFDNATAPAAIVFLRPTVFADPIRPHLDLSEAEWWTPGGLDNFEEWLALLPDDIVSLPAERDVISGRNAVYFEVDIGDDYECGRSGFCAGFLLNTITAEFAVSGWAFERGDHHRVWVVDGGADPPLVIIAVTATGDDTFTAAADQLLAQLVIGEPAPHPVESAESGIDF